MANMTPQPGQAQASNKGSEGPSRTLEGSENQASAVERAAAGASTLTRQQLRNARERMDERISSQRERVTGRVRSLSRALRSAGGMLEDDDLVAQCLDFASEKVEGVAYYVSEITPDQAAEDLRGIARDRPAWFFGGAFVIGLALGRFARATAGDLSKSNTVGATRARTRSAAKPAARETPRTETGTSARVTLPQPTHTGAARP
jgi:hypothetical protein